MKILISQIINNIKQGLKTLPTQPTPKAPAIVITNQTDFDALNQAAQREAIFYFGCQKQFWNWLLISLPFDLLLYAVPLSLMTASLGSLSEQLWQLSLLLTLLTLVSCLTNNFTMFLNPSKFSRLLGHNKTLSWILGGLFGIILLFFLPELISLSLELILPAMVIVSTLYSLYKSAQSSFRDFRTSKLQQLTRSQEFGNNQIFYLQLTGIAAARLISLTGIAASLSNGAHWTGLAYLLTSLVLLLRLYPMEKTYFRNCQGCAIRIPAVIIRTEFCPLCDQRDVMKESLH